MYRNNVVIYSYFAAIIASVSNFWIARRWGRVLVVKLARKDSLDKIDKLADNYGTQTLLIFRLFLREFHDVVSYAYGLTEMEFKRYFLISSLGMIPGTVLVYLISSKIHNPFIYTALNLAIAYITLSIYLLYRRHRASSAKKLTDSK